MYPSIFFKRNLNICHVGFILKSASRFVGPDSTCDFSLTDLVCQSGPGSWPSFVYAESALYPMAQSAAQVYL